MVEDCIRCGITGDKVRLFDCIYDGRSNLICERCAIIENVDILKKPSVQQLKESEKSRDVYERMKHISGYDDKKRENPMQRDQRLKELDKNPRLELPVDVQLNLIDHFHWEIMKNRRRKGLSQRQLAETISESELAIAMLERGRVPENPEVLIKKLEQFFQVNLRRVGEREAYVKRIERNNSNVPILLDEEGHELDHIPEPIIEKVAPIEIIEAPRGPRRITVIPKDKDDEDFIGTPLNPTEKPSFTVGSRKDRLLNNIPKTVELRRDLSKQAIVSPYLNSLKNKEDAYKRFKDPHSLDKKEEIKDIDLESVDKENLTIKDLRDIHRKRLDVSKEERMEEQRRIEERQRLIEARKEELRLKKEKESRKVDDILGGSELLSRKKEDNLKEMHEEQDDELV